MLLKNSSNLSVKDLGKKIKLNGWVQNSRRLGSLIFLDLRDIHGITQIVFSNTSKFFALAETLRKEYVVSIEGKLTKRKSPNLKIKSGKYEVIAENLVIFSSAKRIPLLIAKETDALENIRMKYRYLDLRRPNIKHILLTRSKFLQVTREFFSKNDFHEIETPILSRPTPEGARDFLVPSRIVKNGFFALPQSPQIYKQLLMIAGFEKYFQIAKVFRDEDSRNDRQVEFSQLDIEASFTTEKEVMNFTENYLKLVFKKILNLDFKTKFPVLTYQEAMLKYGSDKPDLRYKLHIEEDTNLFKTLESDLIKKLLTKENKFQYLKLDQELSSKQHKELETYAKSVGASGLMFFAFNKDTKKYTGFLSKYINNEIKKKFKETKSYSVLAIIDKQMNGCKILGSLRTKLASLGYVKIPANQYKFAWITNWPLFELNSEKQLTSVHHPFTAPELENPNLEKLSLDQLLNLKSKAYDITLNGSEIGGGSLRIHNKDLQYKIFAALGFSQKEVDQKFSYFIKAFDYGVPPHGGIALGIDRILQIITNANSIREVIAFPKNTSGYAEMEDAPTEMD